MLLTAVPLTMPYRTDGKTKCHRTIEGYECVCGDGYVPSDNGKCVKLNQCTASEDTLDPECTCDRCACQDLPGAASYKYVHSFQAYSPILAYTDIHQSASRLILWCRALVQ